MRVALVMLVLALEAPVTAQLRDSKALAKDHLDQGLKYYNTQQYDQAIDEWKSAYLLDPDVNTLFAIGQAQRLKGDCKTASETYRSVLRETMPEKQAGEVRRVLGLCEAELKKKSAPEPVSNPPEPPAPKPEPEPEPETSDKGSPWYTDWLADSFAILAVASLAAGGTFYVLAGQAEDDAKAALDFGTFADKAEEADRDRKIMVGSFIAAGVFGAGAILRYATRDGGGEGTQVSASPAPGGALVVVGGSF